MMDVALRGVGATTHTSRRLRSVIFKIDRIHSFDVRSAKGRQVLARLRRVGRSMFDVRVSRRYTALSKYKRCGSDEPNPTCAGPSPYRNRCPNSYSGVCSQCGSVTCHSDGARQRYSGRCHVSASMVRQPPNVGEAPAGASSTHFVSGQAATGDRPWGCLVTSPGENGTVY